MVRAGFLAMLLCGASPEGKGLTICWIDVEGGAATLIITPAGESILVDTGFPGARDTGRIHETAVRLGLKRIDHLITTHWHTDHFGGVAPLAAKMPIAKFYDHGFPEGAKDVDAKLKEAYLKTTGGKSVLVKPGGAITLARTKEGPPLELRFLSADALTPDEADGSPQTRPCPDHPALADDASDNARSVGFLLTYGDFDFLNLGDLTWNVEHKLVCPKNRIGIVDAYQVTHHGQENSGNPVLLRAVAPTVAIMNNGAKKGGKAATFKRLKEIAGLKDIFQMHRNVDTAPGENAPPELTANDAAECKGEGILLSVDPSGKSYAVEVPSKRTKRSYDSK